MQRKKVVLKNSARRAGFQRFIGVDMQVAVMSRRHIGSSSRTCPAMERVEWKRKEPRPTRMMKSQMMKEPGPDDESAPRPPDDSSWWTWTTRGGRGRRDDVVH